MLQEMCKVITIGEWCFHKLKGYKLLMDCLLSQALHKDMVLGVQPVCRSTTRVSAPHSLHLWSQTLPLSWQVETVRCSALFVSLRSLERPIKIKDAVFANMLSSRVNARLGSSMPCCLFSNHFSSQQGNLS